MTSCLLFDALTKSKSLHKIQQTHCPSDSIMQSVLDTASRQPAPVALESVTSVQTAHQNNSCSPHKAGATQTEKEDLFKWV